MNRINEMQNSDEILMYLFAQRKLYDKAEKHKYIVGIITVVIFLCCNIDFVKETIGNVEVSLISGCWILVNIFWQKYINKNIQNAATMKEILDRKLFGFNIEERDIDSNIQEVLRQQAEKIKEKNIDEYVIQAKNTGKDDPPGVRDWYDNISSTISQNQAIYNCQLQNTWWDKKLSKIYITLIYIILAIIFCVIIFIYRDFTIQSFAMKILTSASLVAMIIKEIMSYYEFNKLNTSIVCNIKSIENSSISLNQLENLQAKIYKRRKMQFAVPNILHKALSVKLHSEKNVINI